VDEQQEYPPPFLIEQIMSISHLFGGQLESENWIFSVFLFHILIQEKEKKDIYHIDLLLQYNQKNER